MKARKLYRMNLRRTYARLIVKGKTGNEVVYDFTNGNPVAGIPAKCLVHGEYEQNLLEDSEYFRRKIIALERTEVIEEDEKNDDAAQETGEKTLVVDNVNTVTDAITYCANEFGEVVKSIAQAKACAAKHNVSFPNLKSAKK